MRLRRPDDMLNDPLTHLMTGRLIGAAEMTARYLQIHGDEQAKQVGHRLDDILEFFFENHANRTVEVGKEMERRKQ
jgi:hypothetical protein